MAVPDVLVVGGGAVGVACAYELARAGASVTVVDREPRVGLGCSAGNAGLLSGDLALPLATPAALREGLTSLLDSAAPFHLRPRAALLPWLLRFALAARPGASRRAAAALRPLGLDSHRMHLEYQESGLDLGISRRGALLVWESAAGFESGAREWRESAARIQVLDRSGLRAVEPALADEVAGGVLAEDVAHCDSGQWTRAVADAAQRLGAEFDLGVEVLRLRVEGRRVTGVETDRGPLRAGTTVVAAGAWSGRLTAPIGLRLRLEAGKGYHVDLAPGPGDPQLPVYFQETHVVATPLTRRLRLAGTLDLTGLDPSIDRRRTDAITAAATRGLPGIRGRRVQELWSGLRPCLPSGLPVIGFTRQAQSLMVATGHAMIGLVLAPVTGRLVAELVAGREPSRDISAFAPDG
jgi:D-amino-acid dehydrogenase